MFGNGVTVSTTRVGTPLPTPSRTTMILPSTRTPVPLSLVGGRVNTGGLIPIPIPGTVTPTPRLPMPGSGDQVGPSAGTSGGVPTWLVIGGVVAVVGGVLYFAMKPTKATPNRPRRTVSGKRGGHSARRLPAYFVLVPDRDDRDVYEASQILRRDVASYSVGVGARFNYGSAGAAQRAVTKLRRRGIKANVKRYT